jgi:hypothetical protein
MATLEQRPKNGLGERAARGPGACGQHIHRDGLALLLGTFALAVSPARFLRLAEHGHDAAHVLEFTSRMIGLARLIKTSLNSPLAST